MILNLTKTVDIRKLLDFVLSAKDQSIEVKIHKNTRTNRQNRALHLYFSLVSDELSSAGFELRDLVLDNIPIPITSESIKLLWKQMQEKMYGTTSTTELKTNQISEVYDAMNIVISERLKVHIPFPNFDYKGYE